MAETAAAAPDQVGDAFEQALAQDAQTAPPQLPAPPRQATSADPEAPHGRDENGVPLAPYGIGKNKRPRIKPAGPGRGGRHSAEDEPRSREARPGEITSKPGPAVAPLPPHDFSGALMETGETLWFGGSILARVGPQIPVLGRFVPGTKLAATMAVLNSERPRLAAALNLAAQHDARARKLATRLAAEETSWILSVMFMTAPFAATVAAVWQGDKALAERELPSLETLAKANTAALDEFLAKLAAQMETAQAETIEQMTAATGQPQENAA